MRFASILALLIALVTSCASSTARAAAITVYDSGGFETPRFIPSQNLQGQDAPPAGQGPWVKDPGVSTAVVQTSVVSGGLQAVQISRVANNRGDTRWAVNKPSTPTAEQRVITVEFEMRVQPTTGLQFGPAFGIECYDSSAGAPKLIGSLTVDATTGDVLYQQGGSGNLIESGTIVPLGVFRQYTLAADFSAKKYSIFLDGDLLRTEPFVDSTAARFTDAPLVTFAVTGDTIATATGAAFFDDYVITSIPEPGIMALVVIGAAALRRKGRR